MYDYVRRLERHCGHPIHPPPEESPTAAFKRWLAHDFGRSMSYRSCLALHGVMHSGGVTPTHLIGVNFPMGHLHQLRNRAGALESPLFSRWLQQRQPLVFNAGEHVDWPEITSKWLESFRAHGLNNAAVHGRLDRARSVASYFSFHGLTAPVMAAASSLLTARIDELHERLVSCIEDMSQTTTYQLPTWEELTDRERLIARAVGSGASNQTIANQMGLKENTVKTHMSHILGKLGLRSRAQLCAAISEWPIDGMRWIKILN